MRRRARYQELSEKLYLDNWPKRRRIMYSLLLWAVGNAQYILIWGHDTALHQNALYALLSLIAAIVGSYVFGAVWDDNDKRRRFRHRFDDDEENPGPPSDDGYPEE